MRGLVSRSICVGAVILFVGFISTSNSVNAEAAERSAPERIDEPGPVIDSLLQDLFVSSSAKDRAGLMVAAVRGFEVSENALGDMNQDGMVNIWDLLRIRNIFLGIGDPATSYEEDEGDLDQNSVIDVTDVNSILNALTMETGIPHLIDSTGGEISGANVNLVIPVGGIDNQDIVNVYRLNPNELMSQFGIDVYPEVDSLNYLFGAFEIKNQKGTFYKSPYKIELGLDSIPPCQFAGDNLLMEILDDQDGDGQVELVVRDFMHPSEDSTSIINDIVEAPIINKSRLESFKPGQVLEIPVSNLPFVLPSIIVTFSSPDGSQSTVRAHSFVPSMPISQSAITGVKVVVPLLDNSGMKSVQVINLLSNQVSNSLEIEILPLDLTLINPEDSIVKFFNLLDSVYSLVLTNDSSMLPYPPLAEYLFAEIPKLKNINYQLEQQLLNDISIDSLLLYAEIIDNSKVIEKLEYMTNYLKNSRNESLELFGEGCMVAGAVTTIAGAVIGGPANPVGTAAMAAGATTMAVGWLSDFIGNKLDNADPPLPPPPLPDPPPPIPTDDPPTPGGFVPGGESGGNSPTGGVNPDGGRTTSGCCINIFNYRQNLQGSAGGPGPGGPRSAGTILQKYHLDKSGFNSYKECKLGSNKNIPLDFWNSPLEGAIISPVNARAAYGVVGIVGKAGNWLIPSLPLDYDVTLAMYHPGTGLYDPDVATIHTSSVAGSFGHVLAYFNPDTTVLRFPIKYGQPINNIVSLTSTSYEYWFNVNGDQLGDQVNFGFWSEEQMTLWIQRPDSSFIVKDSAVDCRNVWDVVLDQEGTYRLTVTYGVAGGEGPFEVGVCHQPYFPIHRVCEDVTIPSGDSLIFEPGIEILFSPGVTITNDGYLHLESLDLYTLGGLTLVNNGELDIACDYLEGDLTLINNGTIDFDSTSIEIRQGSVLSHGDSPSVTGNGYPISKITVKSGGTLTHERGILDGLYLVLDTISIELGGSLDVSTKGYRGRGNDGWTGSNSETYPGYTGSSDEAGGSHGGFGGDGFYGDGGEVYDLVDDPHALGAGGGGLASSGGVGANGGGLIMLVVDELRIDGSLIANGGSSPTNRSGSGAGGSINLRANTISGTGVITTNGGASAGDYGGGGGGGRIAIRWNAGDIDNWQLSAQGGNYGTVHNSVEAGGAGTIYLLGPDDGTNGTLMVDNLGRNGVITPLTPERTTFDYVLVKDAANYWIDTAIGTLTVLDSLVVTGSYTDLVCPDSTILSVGHLECRNNSSASLGRGLSINIPTVHIDGSAVVGCETNISFSDASDFLLTNGGTYNNYVPAVFSIPRFDTDNVVSGTFRNWGTIMVAADSIVINAGVTLEENGLLNALDSVSLMRIYGTLSHSPRYMAISYDDNNDTGLVLHLGDLYIESGGSMNVYGKGYRGRNRDGWTGSRSETYPGYVGASSEAGGSHGGLGGDGFYGDGGETYDSLEAPYAMGAGSGGLNSAIGRNGGGYVGIRVDNMSLNGSINANGENSIGDRIGGAAGGGILIYVRVASGSGTISANAGNGSWAGGGGGGGRIGIFWEAGDVSGWTTSVNGGSGGQYGDPGQAGTVNIENTTKKLTQER